MRIRFAELWRWDGTVDRRPYALIGVFGFLIKHNIDRAVATFAFHRPWGWFNYWVSPTKAMRLGSLPREDAVFLGVMVAIALPFIWVGVALTLKRLRAVGLPAWLVVIFFMPVINLLFFLILSIVPSRPARPPVIPGGRIQGALMRVMPQDPLGSAATAVLLMLILGVAAAQLGTRTFARYGWGLFVAMPFCLGLGSVLLYGYHRARSYRSCVGVACLSVMLVGLVLFAVAFEGIVCLAIALPMALPLAAMGGSVGYLIQRRPWAASQAPSMMLVLILFIPGVMETEEVSRPRPPLFEVSTRVEIAAPPEEVWRNVISFPRLPEPEEWLFRLGVAFPTRAEIRGRGAGAVRLCVFSTGAFIEPIEVWDEPRLLRFSVTSSPEPMEELTPYPDVRPPHLAGFLVAREGEFRLSRLASGGTLLVGTTWYEHHMWPAIYWELWSDTMIHRIHLRVLEHIKRLAEHAEASKVAGKPRSTGGTLRDQEN